MQEQNWAIAQSSEGVIYVANNYNLQYFDGVSWNSIVIPNGSVRSLDIIQNQIYLGSISDFGKIITDSSFNPIYNSFLPLINKDSTHFTNVFQTVPANDGIYFRSTEYLFRYDGRSIKLWKPQTSFGRMYNVNNHLYVNEKNLGLHEIIGENIIPVAGGEIFADKFVATMIEIDNNQTLIGTRTKGFYLKSGSEIINFTTQADDYTNGNRLYNGIKLSDGNIALGMLSGGIIVISPDGTLQKVFTQSNGLQDNNVKNIFQDSEQNIWAALNDGISKIEYPAIFEFFDNRMNLDGIVLSVRIKDNLLYAGTSGGLFVKRSDVDPLQVTPFERISGIQSNVWYLFDNGKSLLAGTNEGIFIIDETKAVQISTIGAYEIHKIPGKQNLFLICTKNGINVLDTGNGDGKTYKILDSITEEIRSARFDSRNDLWLGTISSGVIHAQYFIEEVNGLISAGNSPGVAVVKRYNTGDGLPSGTIDVRYINNKPYFLTSEGLYNFGETSGTFNPDSILGGEFADGSRNIFLMENDFKGNIWFHSKLKNFFAEKQSDGSYKVHSKPFSRLAREQVNSIYFNGDITWFATNKGIVKYYANINKTIDTTFNALIRKVYVRNDSLVYGGASIPDDFIPLSLTYNLRNLRFEYACPFYEASDMTTIGRIG